MTVVLNTFADISSHQADAGPIDLRAYWNDGHRTLAMKATEGTGYSWPLMQSLARQWHSFGPDAQCVFYHWLYGTLSAAAQHAWFWSHVEPVFRAGDLLMTDFEDVAPDRWVSDAQHCAVVKDFNALCDAHAPVLDYAPNWYLANMPLCIAYFQGRPHWQPSDYSNDPPLNPHGFHVAGHQFTDRATVAGFHGPVDYNRWIDPQFMTLGTDDQVTPDEIDTIVTKTADAVYLKLLKTDGVLNSPADAGDHATNPFWGWQTHIEATTTAARAARTDTAFIRTQLAAILKAITDNAGTDTASAAALKVLVDPSGGVLPRVVDLQRRLDALTVGPVAGLDGASFTIHTQPAAA